ncbi:1-phosphofructokinase [Halonatronum saccharophilum]|uniref:1-phosphofructokinase n=1 Tax=Halonatronum saccharophilum TaxID=150060 RepID=UPI000481F3A2|nr:1-phosphofructokinase [Halonatronum saccharophilum]
MITTLTLNPAVDKTAKVENLRLGQLNRIKNQRSDIGGKGINVSRAVAELGGKTKALGFIAGNNGDYISQSLKSLGVEYDFNIVKGETRTNLKLIDTVKGQETEINEPGPKISKDDLINLEDKLLSLVREGDFVVLTGSLPRGVPKSFYAQMIKKLKKLRIKVVLDSSAKALELAIKEKPYLIKPNLKELEKLLDRKLKNREEVIKAAYNLHINGIEIVVISLGKEGAIVVSKEGNYKVTPPQINASSTVGAGDTLVGALAFKLNEGRSLRESLIYATAASANSVSKAGTQLCVKVEVEKLLDSVNIEKLKEEI